MKLVTDVLIEKLNEYKNRIAFIDAKKSEKISYSEVKTIILKLVKLIDKYSFGSQKNIISYIKTQPMFYIIQMAVILSKNISVLCDASDSFSSMQNFINESESNIIFTDNIQFIETLQKTENRQLSIFYLGKNKDVSAYNSDNLTVIDIYSYLNDCEVNENEVNLNRGINPDDIAYILFSSGTTGQSKGIIITHKNFIAEQRVLIKTYYAEKRKTCLSVLPSSHRGPFVTSFHLFLLGNTIIIDDYLNYEKVLSQYNLKHVIVVPKMLSILADNYQKILEKENQKFNQIHKYFFDLSKKYLELRNKNNLSFLERIRLLLLKISNWYGINFVFSKILNKIHLKTKANLIVMGANLDINLEIFFKVLGMSFSMVYGLTETGMLAYTNRYTKKVGSVGKLNPDALIIISDPNTGEVLPVNSAGLIKAKTDQIMKGYIDTEATKKAFDSDGYFITGDIGYISEDGYLFFRGRLKNVIVLNNGENINPEWIEELCLNSKFVSQIMLVGQDKPYLTAVIVPDMKYISDNFNVQNPNEIKNEIIININDILGNSPSFKWIYQIKNILLVDEPFTYENGLLTKKMSVNKTAVLNKYSELIDKLYEDE